MSTDYLAKVIEEQKELKAKLDRLTAFNDSDKVQKLTESHRKLLIEQEHCMLQYNATLLARIELMQQEN